ncbi:hypothetical protein UPYG_G00007450 [Umbra pygmaea]|uniref:CBM21 domain-containing protein n=1 Tax=Umbra pygmaea TaxID=75934 RepID=A0ABD0Y556_UMBPY
MAEKMSFLTIPDRKGLFKNEGSPIRAQCDEGQSNSDEEYEESEETNMRLIPRCSPIPRKRGQSIYDETEEYMKIKDAIPSRRVSFADTLGGDLAHVKEFEQFYSDEEGDARLEEEEAKYRPKTSEPTYRLSPEWTMPTTITLTKAVHTNKVEVESVSTIEGEPLAFTVIIRVLNISFIKTVCVRSTMDNWKTYFDCPAEYLQGDGETDKFSFKLSFCPPYLYHGARIEFVVRYETPDGDYWANNSQMNYAVTLIVSYEDNVAQAKTSDMPYRRSILKTESSYRMDDSDYFEQFTEKNEDEAATKTLAEMKPTHVCPDVLQPELDLETAEDSHSSLPANLDLLSADGSLPCTTVSLGKQSPIVSSTSTTNALISRPVATQANIMTAKPEPSQELVCDLPIPDCEIPNMDPEQDHLSKDTLEHVRPPPALKSPLHISIDEASETAPTQTIAEGPGGEEEEGGNSREEPKDSTRLWLSPSVPTVEVEHSDEQLGGTSTWNCAQPYPCHMDIEANRSSPEDVLYQKVHLAKLDILRKEEDVMEEVLKQGSKVEEEVLRQEAQIETDEEKQKSFTIQELITTSSSNLNPPSQPAPCKLGTSEDGRKSQFQTSGTSPPLSEEKQQTTMDDGLSRGGVVLVMEAVGSPTREVPGRW